ncbi:hypothetical protein [Chryseobacterium indoltheticum]|uniref:hypothetical protein n=1 Tax=Chryseobacterium indoltheticum TaxID=254 RepID=UPI003F491C63
MKQRLKKSWEIVPGEYKHIDILISDKKYIHFDAQMKPFYEILDQVNKATENLALLLNDDKTIEKIENEELILEKWEEIKRKELQFSAVGKNSYNEIINIYDKEFRELKIILKPIFFIR